MFRDFCRVKMEKMEKTNIFIWRMLTSDRSSLAVQFALAFVHNTDTYALCRPVSTAVFKLMEKLPPSLFKDSDFCKSNFILFIFGTFIIGKKYFLNSYIESVPDFFSTTIAIYILYWTVSIAIAYLMYRHIEKPFLMLRERGYRIKSFSNEIR